MTTNCRRAAKHITAYVDGQLAPRHRAAMERHLARCEECSRRVAEERATKSLVRRVHVAVAAPERLRQQMPGVDVKLFDTPAVRRETPG